MTVISVINQLTQRLVRGDTPNTADALLYSPVEVVRVGLKSDTSDYTESLDFQIFDDEISWILGGTEPTPGQIYYITYNYNPPQFIKDFDTVVDELTTDFNTLVPNLDVTKSVARDLFINVMSRQFSDQYVSARHVFLIQSLQNIDEISDEELDAYGENFSRPRLPATNATGLVKFGMNIARAYQVNIPAGTRVGTQPSLTNNKQITFLTTVPTSIVAGEIYAMIPVEAEESGILGNVGAGTIKLLTDPVDVDYIVNSIATTGGVDKESNENYVQRLMTVYKSRNIATKTGIREVVQAQPNVIDVYIAGVGDPVMVRDGGLGGKVDVYIQAESGFQGIITDETYAYTGADYVFLKQPIIGISEVKVNDVPIPATNFNLIKDTGIYAESTRAFDKLQITAGAIPTDVIKVTYIYNLLFNDIQDLMDSDPYHIAGIDVLIRSAVETHVDVTGSVQIKTGYVFADVRDDIVTQLTEYIEEKEIGSRIVYGDVLNIIHDTEGVADIRPLSRLSRSTENTNATIQLLGNEFPRAGTIVINQII